MEKTGKNQRKEFGQSEYLNKNCWIVRNFNYPPYKRCQFCKLKFRNCLFLHYQIISLILTIFFLTLSFLIEGKISELVIISIFTLIIVYGYFFNKSMDKIIQANFAQRKANKALEELTEKLEEMVEDQTKNIKEKSRHLQELLNMKTDFLRVANHQLNTPLSIMKGYFSMAEEGSYPTEKAMPSIKKSLDRISSTVADFWDAYELEGERMKMEPQKTDIAEIISRLVLEKQKIQSTREKKLTIEILDSGFKAPAVWCDCKKIAHVISNLLDNAVSYTSQGKIIVYYELLDNNYLKINVKDTGVGIFGDDKKKIFQKFSRGGNAANLRPDGSGLGLFIAQKIVEGNLGELSYVSQGKDKGSTFSFTVPIYKNQSLELNREESISRKKIIIFDKA